MRIHLIVAMSKDRVIGNAGGIPWHLSEDLKRFKAITMGHPMLMGRKTWDSIGRPLPGRESIVITRRRDFSAPGATVVHSLDDAIAHAQARGATDAFVIGGGEIYRESLARADVLHLTVLHTAVEGDTTFPEIVEKEWRETAREEKTQAGDLPMRYDFVTLERRA